MLSFTESFLAWTAATLIPAFLGLLDLTWARKLGEDQVSCGVRPWHFPLVLLGYNWRLSEPGC